MCERLDHAADGARTISELLAAYRRAALDLSQAVQKPVQARRDRNLRGALDYIHRHYRERLSQAQSAFANNEFLTSTDQPIYYIPRNQRNWQPPIGYEAVYRNNTFTIWSATSRKTSRLSNTAP